MAPADALELEPELELDDDLEIEVRKDDAEDDVGARDDEDEEEEGLTDDEGREEEEVAVVEVAMVIGLVDLRLFVFTAGSTLANVLCRAAAVVDVRPLLPLLLVFTPPLFA